MTCAAVVLGVLSTTPYLGEGRADFARLEYEKALGPLALATQVLATRPPPATTLERSTVMAMSVLSSAANP